MLEYFDNNNLVSYDFEDKIIMNKLKIPKNIKFFNNCNLLYTYEYDDKNNNSIINLYNKDATLKKSVKLFKTGGWVRLQISSDCSKLLAWDDYENIHIYDLINNILIWKIEREDYNISQFDLTKKGNIMCCYSQYTNTINVFNIKSKLLIKSFLIESDEDEDYDDGKVIFKENYEFYIIKKNRIFIYDYIKNSLIKNNYISDFSKICIGRNFMGFLKNKELLVQPIKFMQFFNKKINCIESKFQIKKFIVVFDEILKVDLLIYSFENFGDIQLNVYDLTNDNLKFHIKNFKGNNFRYCQITSQIIKFIKKIEISNNIPNNLISNFIY